MAGRLRSARDRITSETIRRRDTTQSTTSRRSRMRPAVFTGRGYRTVRKLWTRDGRCNRPSRLAREASTQRRGGPSALLVVCVCCRRRFRRSGAWRAEGNRLGQQVRGATTPGDHAVDGPVAGRRLQRHQVVRRGEGVGLRPRRAGTPRRAARRPALPASARRYRPSERPRPGSTPIQAGSVTTVGLITAGTIPAQIAVWRGSGPDRRRSGGQQPVERRRDVAVGGAPGATRPRPRRASSRPSCSSCSPSVSSSTSRRGSRGRPGGGRARRCARRR